MENEIDGKQVRETRIDRMKGLLCLLMLLAHAVYSFGYEQTGSTIWKLISHAVNLTAFPGFLFCFGYASERAYLSKGDRTFARPRLIRRFWILLGAYYVTALWETQLRGAPFDISALAEVAHLTKICGQTYLLSFAMLFLLILVFYNGLNRLLAKSWAVAIAVAVSLIFAALPAIGLPLPIIGILIKANIYIGFPVLAYAGFFLLGAFMSRRRLVWNRRIGIFALAGFAAFMACVVLTRKLPERFPPSIFWVLGGYLPVYALYLLCGLVRGKRADAALIPFGRHTLYYLVASNVLLVAYETITHAARCAMPRPWYLLGYIALVLVCWGGLNLWQFLRAKSGK